MFNVTVPGLLAVVLACVLYAALYLAFRDTGPKYVGRHRMAPRNPAQHRGDYDVEEAKWRPPFADMDDEETK